jgi:anti-anti-sigma factor
MTKDWRNVLGREESRRGKILYARYEDIYVLKFIGGIHYGQCWSFDLSKALATFLDRIFDEHDFQNLIVDLTEATSIDSTNLGLLARIAIFMQDEFGRKPTIVSTNPDISATLRTVGFRQIFEIFEKPVGTPEAEAELPAEGEHEINVQKMLLVAHRTLSALNEQNAERFKDLVETLEDQMARDTKPR